MNRKIKVKRLEGSPYAIEQDVAGKGATATIVKAYNIDHLNEELACKIINIKEEQNNEVCKTQLLVLKQLPLHPNLVNYKKIQISSQKNLYLIMEYCNGGNLQKYLFDNKYQIPQDKIWFFLKQFIQGYKVLYDNSLVHRDIKPENILIHNGSFKIADFGLSKVVSHPEALSNFSVKGTPIYMAPQIPEHKEGNAKVDVFSLGVVVYRLAFKGDFPFFDQGRKYKSINEYFRQLKIKKLNIPKNSEHSEELLDLISRMLQKDQEKRISWKQLFNYPRIVKAFRCDRNKQLTNMEVFKKSLVFVNKSVIKLSEVESSKEVQEQKEDQSCLILEEAFNKNNKSIFEQKLYKYKLLYTIIEYTITKIKNYLKKTEKVHHHVKKILNKLAVQGLEFSLYVINSLRDISGEWEQFSTYEINNFENIFDNDRAILEEELSKIFDETEIKNYSSHLHLAQSKVISQQRKSKITRLSFEDILYRFLTEYYEYPSELRNQLRTIAILLIDVYDMVLKFESGWQGKWGQEQQGKVEGIEKEEKDAFYRYLMQSQKMGERQLFIEMEKKGLLIK